MLTDNALQRKMINYCIFGCAWIKIICKQYDMEIPLFKTKHYSQTLILRNGGLQIRSDRDFISL